MRRAPPTAPRRLFRLLPFAMGVLACREPAGFVAPDPHVAFVEGKVAHFDSLEATLKMYNFSWFPRDDAFTPRPDTALVTVLLGVENTSGTPMPLTVESFSWRSLLLGKPGEGPLWPMVSDGRPPRLDSATLPPGGSVEGWLTFAVPADEYGDELVWRPAPGVTLAIPVPLSLASPRFDHRGLIFGRITDPDGLPVAGAQIELELRSESCDASPDGVGRLETDAAGWYLAPLQTSDGDVLCVAVGVTPPIDSGLMGAQVRGRTICPAQPAPDREPPELRVDVILPFG